LTAWFLFSDKIDAILYTCVSGRLIKFYTTCVFKRRDYIYTFHQPILSFIPINLYPLLIFIMSKFILTALLTTFVLIKVFMTCTNAASGTSDSISHHDQPEPNSPSSFEDALIYPKQAISPYHINERPSNAFVKPISQKIPKITLKIGKIREEEVWKRFRYQESPSQSTKKQKNSNYDSDGRSPPTKILRHSFSGKLKKHDKFEKAMKSMKNFTKTFKSPEERLKMKKIFMQNNIQQKIKKYQENFQERFEVNK
jgi:hypothetical protein